MNGQTPNGFNIPNKQNVQRRETAGRETAGRETAGREVLTPGEWLRRVGGVTAPFGFDRMPTVLG